MTPQEAIDKIESGTCRFCTIDEHCDDCEFQMAIEALEKQIPKKVVKIGMAVYECPNCGLVVDCMKYPVSYCSICGQAIDWLGVEE